MAQQKFVDSKEAVKKLREKEGTDAASVRPKTAWDFQGTILIELAVYTALVWCDINQQIFPFFNRHGCIGSFERISILRNNNKIKLIWS